MSSRINIGVVGCARIFTAHLQGLSNSESTASSREVRTLVATARPQ
jgi:hypothetical protein